MIRVLWTSLVGGLVTALMLGQPARADAPRAQADKPQTYVVLVGISKYADKQIKPRPNAEKDVRALYELLSNKEHLQTDPKNVRLLLGSEEDKDKKATRENFLSALKWLAEQAKEGDTAILAFVGQGGPLGNSGDGRCYFLANSTFAGRAKDAVAPEEIEDVLKKYKGKNLCVFLDVNFKGYVEDGNSRAISEPTLGKAPYREFLGDDGSDEHLPLPGRIAFLATNGLNASLDLEKHGLFSTVLLEAFRGQADNDGKEADGLVCVDEIARYMNKRLPELARAHGKTEKEKEQDHYVLFGTSARFVLTTNPKAIGATQKRLARFEEMLKSGHYLSKHSEQARTLLGRVPPLEAHRQLRALYKKAVETSLTEKDFNTERDRILASMRLTPREATQFSEKVLEVIEIMVEEYFRDVRPGEMVAHAVRGLYSTLEEKVPPGVEQELGGLKVVRRADRLREALSKARLALGRREDLDNTKDLTIALQRMLHKLDPHTTYIDPESKKKFDDDIAGNFTGIGVQIRKDAASDQLLIVTPIKGSPAFKVGLQAGDLISEIIRKVDSENKPVPPDQQVIATKGLPLNKAVKLILGQPDTQVTLTIVRDGVAMKKTITRGKVEVESVLGARRKVNGDWDYVIDNENKIGYIRLTSFARNSYRDMDLILDELVRKHGLKGFIFDLRFNPGGLLDVAVKISDLFINDGTIVKIRPRGTGEQRPIKGREAGTLPYFPMAVLVNGYSASGSEIVAAALQDHGHARIFGERSYGKGSVQNIRELDVIDPKSGETRKAEVKLTTALFYSPLGKNLNKATATGKEKDEWGVKPDEGCRVSLSPAERRDLAEHLRNLETIERPDRYGKSAKEFKDRQLNAALEYVKGMIKGRAKHGDRFQPRKAG